MNLLIASMACDQNDIDDDAMVCSGHLIDHVESRTQAKWHQPE